jgi:uncharacterized membrane protein
MDRAPDLPRGPSPRPGAAPGTQIATSLIVGAVTAIPVASATDWGLLPILLWDASSLVYLGWIWSTIWPLDAERTARLAVPADPARAAADALLLAASLASLVAVGFVLGSAASSHGATQVLLAGLGVASVVLSWGIVHTVYTLRYAHLYYTGEDGGIDFNDRVSPSYTDFAYVAFTLGMTFQISDTELQTNELRRTALTHALLSYVFSTGILATTINLIASLGT